MLKLQNKIMFSVEPFRIVSYPPQIAAFGGVEYSSPGLDVNTITREVSDVVRSLGNSLEQAYEVKTVLQSPRENFLSTKITPIKAELDRRSVDIDLRYNEKSETIRELKILMRRMAAENRNNAIITRKDNKGLYILHDMKKYFDPESVGELLQTTKCLLFKIARQKVTKTNRKILPEYLEVDVELKAPDPKLYY